MTEAARRLATGPEDLNLATRCITRGAPKLPGSENNNFLILQTPQSVAILQEMIHEVRVIPLDPRPHLPESVRQWMGDSRGRWEGSTLVVDTTNYADKIAFNSLNCCRGSGRNLHIVERYTRVSEGRIDVSITVEDPTTFTSSYRIALPMMRTAGPLYEYACHEGNFGMTGILAGSRAEEKAAAGASPQGSR